jgi:hypothetical protein
MIVRDATEDPRFRDSSLVQADPRIRFYAGFPLVTSDGLSLGALCAIDRKPRQLDPQQQQAMQSLARQAMALLDLRRVSMRLAETLENVKTLEGLLPLCAWCKKVRDDNGYWNQLADYLTSRTGVLITHGNGSESPIYAGERPAEATVKGKGFYRVTAWQLAQAASAKPA